MRSAIPQLSKKVAQDTGPLQKSLAKAIISMSPSRITAALVLSPKPSPSQKPAPTATTFFGEWRSQVRKDPSQQASRHLPHAPSISQDTPLNK